MKVILKMSEPRGGGNSSSNVLIFGGLALVLLLGSGVIGVATLFGGLTATLSTINNSGGNVGVLPSCDSFAIGSDISVNGLKQQYQRDSAALIVQEAMNRGLGEYGAAVAMTAAITESGLTPHSDGEVEGLHYGYDRFNWSYGLFRTQLHNQLGQVAWKKPNGGFYPREDSASIAKAQAIALDPAWQVNWFFNRMTGVDYQSKSLRNFKWRDDPKYKDKPWILAQKVENSAFPDGSNYRKVWEGNKDGWNITPLEIVRQIIVAGGGFAESDTITTLDTPFLLSNFNETTGAYVIENPSNTSLTSNGYPVISLAKDSRLVKGSLAGNTNPYKVSDWAKPIFDDFISRWQKSIAFSDGRLSLRRGDSQILGWTKPIGDQLSPRFSGTALSIQPIPFRKNAPTSDEMVSIRKLVKDMGGMITWGGLNDPSMFYISKDIGPLELDKWGAISTSAGNPPYFFVGDFLGKSVGASLKGQVEKLSANVKDKRNIVQGVVALNGDRNAKNAKTWIIQLGTTESNDPIKLAKYVEIIMNSAGSRKVYWVNTYRPPTFPALGNAAQNNAILKEKADLYGSLKLIDWSTAASANPAWFANDISGGYIAPNAAGQLALTNMIVQAITQNGDVVSALSSLCGDGTGIVDPTRDLGIDASSAEFTTNLTTTFRGAESALKRAANFTREPPCADGKCEGLCGRLTANIWGRGSSGFATARLQWFASVQKGIAVPSIDPATGQKNLAAWDIPLGALLYWADECPTCSSTPAERDAGGGKLNTGHVATWVGGGQLISNYDGPQGMGVYKVTPGQISYYKYLGWAPPIWNS
jgi:hypothetical protein